MTSPFDYVNSINVNKTNMMRDTENDVLAEKEYNPWIVNKALSYFPDTVLIANDTNMYHGLNNRAQYEYLLNMVRRGKRFSKWVKDTESDDIELIRKAYTCNSRVAREYLMLLTKPQLDAIRASMAIGGSK